MMFIKREILHLEEFEPWSGAKETWKKICDAGLGGDFIDALEELYPDGIKEVELNDLLWFEPDVCYEMVGLPTESEEE